jgi:hypothetical protein
MTCDDFALAIDDYLTGRLAPAQREAMDEHARLCPSCGDLLRELEEAAAFVRLMAPQVEPPLALRGRILAAVRAGAAPIRASDGTAPVLAHSPRPARRPGWRWRLSLTQVAAAMSALSLLLVVALAAWVVALHGELNRQAAENARLAEQVASQRYAVYSLRRSIATLSLPNRVDRTLAGSERAPNARGLVYYDPSQPRGMLIASDLPLPSPSQAYQIWGRSKDGPVSLGILRFDEEGRGYAVLDSPVPLGQFEGIGISLEPAGGSPQPTGPRMLSGGL